MPKQKKENVVIHDQKPVDLQFYRFEGDEVTEEPIVYELKHIQASLSMLQPLELLAVLRIINSSIATVKLEQFKNVEIKEVIKDGKKAQVVTNLHETGSQTVRAKILVRQMQKEVIDMLNEMEMADIAFDQWKQGNDIDTLTINNKETFNA